MSITQMFLFCLEKQDKLNTSINPKWIEERTLNDFSTAIFTECAELIESTSWKWWKYQEEDIFNTKLEIVDIYHFILSYLILYSKKEINKKILGKEPSFIDLSILLTTAYEKATPDLNVVEKAKQVATEFYLYSQSENEFDFLFLEYPLKFFFELVKARFDDFEGFFKFYLVKLALNHFRQQNSYQTGNYEKVIDGIEDNYRFFSKVSDFSLKDVDLDNIEEILIQRYINSLGL